LLWWTKNEPLYPTSYKPSTEGFLKELIRSKTQFWTVDETSVRHSFIECVEKFCFGHLKFLQDKYLEIVDKCINNFDFTSNYCLTNEDVDKISHHYKVNIYVFYEKPIIGGRKIDLKYKTKTNYEDNVPLLQSYKLLNYYALIWPNKNGKISALGSKRYCNNHGNWVNISASETWKKHVSKCFKCHCGRQYNKGDVHPLNCQKPHYDKKRRQERSEMKRYKAENGEYSIDNCYFADLETLIETNGKYKTYAAAYIDASPKDKVNIFIGNESMDDFMWHLIENCHGVMWFFNGVRFDNFFLLPWLLKNRIPINPNGTIIVDNTILSLTFSTKKGEVSLKDLGKFLQGSLKANCKAFGLDKDKSKTDFDHDSVQNWEDVEKERELIHKYLSLDVISLKHIYMKYSKTIFDLYNIHVGKYMTSSHLAFGAFTSTLPKHIKIYKTKREHEEVMRKLYIGGRVHCGRPCWASKQWDEITTFMKKEFFVDEDGELKEKPGHIITKEMYDKITDFLDYVDANSLYPAAQVDREYPVGRERWIDYPPNSDHHKRMIHDLNTKQEKIRRHVLISAFKVDITCPKNLSIPFLMEKNKDGGILQDLNDKKEYWTTGPELWEAIELGYRVTRIYQQIKWEKGFQIFNDYVKKTYQKKKEADKDTPIYTAVKLMLNALTGKFGQHTVLSAIQLFYKNDTIDDPMRNVTEIYDEDDFLIGWYGVKDVEHEYAPFPIHLSAFILGWSKVIMSQFLREMKIEKDDIYCPMYGDTDSLILHHDAFQRLPDKYKGDKELGQLKLEVSGKVIAIYVLAPKTYNITYIDEKTLQIKTKTRSKGIPHDPNDYDAFEMYEVNDKKKKVALKEAQFLDDRSKTAGLSKVLFSDTPLDLTDRIYIFKDTDQEIVKCCSKIPSLYFVEILNRQMTVECVFGGMIRNFEPGEVGNIYIARDTKKRTMNKSYWWGKNYRILSDLDVGVEYPTAYAFGHEKVMKQFE
jgi:hypothetical protein